MKKLILGLIALCFAVVLPPGLMSKPAKAADFPTRPVKIVHGSRAGAPQDVMIRVLAEELTKELGQPVVVEPRPGGSGAAAIAHMMGQRHDGHVLFAGGSGIIQTLQMPSSPFPIDSVEPVYRAELDPFALYVKRGGKFETLEDLLKAMQEDPGQVRIGGYGTASGQHLAALDLAEAAGVKLNWVPFEGGSQAIAAVIGGNLDAAMSNMAVLRRFKDNTVVLGMSDTKRMSTAPEVPTFKELGIDIAPMHWRAFFAPKGTPEENRKVLHAAFKKAGASEAFQEYLAKAGTADGSMPLEEFEAWFTKQHENALARLKEHGFLR